MAETKNSKAVVKYDNISDQVLQKIKDYETNGGLVIPKNYSVTNQMKAAWLVFKTPRIRTTIKPWRFVLKAQ